jgi:hypothetical protein
MDQLERVVVAGEYPYTVTVPANWHELPSLECLGTAGWINAWLEPFALPGERHRSLADELPAVARFIRGQFSTDQSWFAVIDDSGVGGVRALASLVTYASRGLSARNMHARLDRAAEQARHVDVLSRQSMTVTIGGLPAVVVHDLIVLSGDDEGATTSLSERYVGMMFPTTAPVIVQLEIQAPDLAVFDDVVDAGNTVLAGVRIDEAALAARTRRAH